MDDLLKKLHSLSQRQLKTLASFCGGLAALILVALLLSGGVRTQNVLSRANLSPASQTASWFSCWLNGNCNGNGGSGTCSLSISTTTITEGSGVTPTVTWNYSYDTYAGNVSDSYGWTSYTAYSGSEAVSPPPTQTDKFEYCANDLSGRPFCPCAPVTLTVLLPTPTLTISADSGNIMVGQSTVVRAGYTVGSGDTLTGASLNEVPLTGSEFTIPGYSNNVVTSYTYTFTPASAGTYTFKPYITTSAYPSSSSYGQSVTITVTTPLTVSANPTSVNSNSTSTVTWEAPYAVPGTSSITPSPASSGGGTTDMTSWTNVGTLPASAPLGYSMPVIVGNYIYRFGGSDGTTGYTNVISRAPISDPGNWSNVGTLPTIRGGGAVAVVGSNIFLFGGMTNTAGTAWNGEIYTAPVSNPLNWSDTGVSLATLGAPVIWQNFAVIGDNLYFFGGETATSSYTPSIWRASDQAPTSWAPVSSLPAASPVARSGVAIYNGNVYLFGGIVAGTSAVYTKNICTASLASLGAWTCNNSFPTTLALPDIIIAGSTVYSIGGTTNGSTWVGTVQHASMSNLSSWLTDVTLGTGTGAGASGAPIVVGNAMYLIGGAASNGQLSETIYSAPVANNLPFQAYSLPYWITDNSMNSGITWPLTSATTYTLAAVKKIYLTSPTGSNQTFTSPADWNNANNTIEVIGAGGSGAAAHYNGSTGAAVASGGGAGGYSKISNFTFANPGVTTATWQVGTGGPSHNTSTAAQGSVGGDTWFNATAFPTSGTAVGAKGGGAGGGTQSSGTENGGAGGAATSGYAPGGTKHSGGRGGNATAATGSQASAGGGGAAGLNGDGNQGVDVSNLPGAGGSADAGLGGGGGSAASGTGTAGHTGGNGTEWDASDGSGGGGGSGKNSDVAGAGGLYGGGGGGASSNSVTTPVSGAGWPGIIVITYTPVVSATVSLNLQCTTGTNKAAPGSCTTSCELDSNSSNAPATVTWCCPGGGGAVSNSGSGSTNVTASGQTGVTAGSYSLTCPTGVTQSPLVINPLSSLPGIRYFIPASRVRSGSASTLNWEIDGMIAGISCSIVPVPASGQIAWNSQPTWSGSATTNPITQITSFTLSCGNGQATTSATTNATLVPSVQEI
ncbi:MAG: hypothetical protein KGH79_03505 [Patescibacteria group bacterium]|nr:hypothetical protein [Patescibacteria group bacterium]